MIWAGRIDHLVGDMTSGHAFIIDGRIKGIILMVLYSKAFRKFDAAEKRGEAPEEHDCSKNSEVR